MDLQDRVRQFYLRITLVSGIVWGMIPLITVMFISKGAHDSNWDVLAAVSNSFTVLPASVLAFWHRRVACLWFTLNAAFIVPITVSFFLRTHGYEFGRIVGVLMPVLLAIVLDFMEVSRWPGAVDK